MFVRGRGFEKGLIRWPFCREPDVVVADVDDRSSVHRSIAPKGLNEFRIAPLSARPARPDSRRQIAILWRSQSANADRPRWCRTRSSVANAHFVPSLRRSDARSAEQVRVLDGPRTTRNIGTFTESGSEKVDSEDTKLSTPLLRQSYFSHGADRTALVRSGIGRPYHRSASVPSCETFRVTWRQSYDGTGLQSSTWLHGWTECQRLDNVIEDKTLGEDYFARSAGR